MKFLFKSFTNLSEEYFTDFFWNFKYIIYEQSVWKTRYNLKDNSKIQAWYVEKLTLLYYFTLFSNV